MKRAAIDPGKRHAGIALFAGNELVGATLLKTKSVWPQCVVELASKAVTFVKEAGMGELDELLLEYPKVARQWAKGDPNDLVALAYTQGAMTTALPAKEVKAIEPQAWKGTVDADIVTERIKVQLTPVEQGKVYATDHNTYDAVGIGLWKCGRLHKGRAA